MNKEPPQPHCNRQGDDSSQENFTPCSGYIGRIQGGGKDEMGFVFHIITREPGRCQGLLSMVWHYCFTHAPKVHVTPLTKGVSVSLTAVS